MCQLLRNYLSESNRLTMKNQKNKSSKDWSNQELTNELAARVKNNALTLSEIMELLRILLKVNQETPIFRNNPNKDDEPKSKKGAIDYEYRRNKILSLGWKCLKCERPLLSSTKNGFNWLKNTITNQDECFCDDCFIKVKKKKNYSEYEQ